MSIDYYYANHTKRERFAVDVMGGSTNLRGIGFGLASRAFHLMLVGGMGNTPVGMYGRWSADSVALVDDGFKPAAGSFWDEYTDLSANAILLVFEMDGFARIGDVAQTDSTLFMQLSHLVVSRQVPELEPHLKERFGANFQARYKQLCKQRRWFRPKNLVLVSPGR